MPGRFINGVISEFQISHGGLVIPTGIPRMSKLDDIPGVRKPFGVSEIDATIAS
jgi:hypothetical protein